MAKLNFKKLGISLLIDLIGALPTALVLFGTGATFGFLAPLIPFAESFDIIWAPVSGVLVWMLYKNKTLSAIALIEELLPFTDLLPTATIGWFVETLSYKRSRGTRMGIPNLSDAKAFCNAKFDRDEDRKACIERLRK